MGEEFPYISVPEEFEAVVGRPQPGTRLYRRDGSQEEAAPWFEFIAEHFEASLSPGGAGMYCPVSRAAVYKRIKEGRLTFFAFHVTHCKTGLFGKQKLFRDRPYGCIPTSELKAWRKELEERAIRQGVVTQEELEGAKPDWDGEFLDWPKKKERVTLLQMLEQDGVSLPAFIVELLKTEIADSVSAKLDTFLGKDVKAKRLKKLIQERDAMRKRSAERNLLSDEEGLR